MYNDQPAPQPADTALQYEYKSLFIDVSMRESCVEAQKLFGWEFYEIKHHYSSEKEFLGYHTEYYRDRSNIWGGDELHAYTTPVYKTNTYHVAEYVFRRDINSPYRNAWNKLENRIPLADHYSGTTPPPLCYVRKPDKSFMTGLFNVISIIAAIVLVISVIIAVVGETGVKPTDYLIIAAIVVVFMITICLNVHNSGKKKKYKKYFEKLIADIKRRIAEEMEILIATKQV